MKCRFRASPQGTYNPVVDKRFRNRRQYWAICNYALNYLPRTANIQDYKLLAKILKIGRGEWNREENKLGDLKRL